MQEFFHMGGNAFYVWSAYGVTTAGLLLTLIFANRRKKVIAKEILDALED